MSNGNGLSRLTVTTKSGGEPVHDGGRPLGPRLLDFWRWAVSDLVSNATRGVLAEFIVGSALGIDFDVRNEWDAYDLETRGGVRVEVKSAAYVQSWAQRVPSRISFIIKPSAAPVSDSGTYAQTRDRHADVYVFALLHESDQARIDPLDVSQWTFFVLPTRVLNEKRPGSSSIGLDPLRQIGAIECAYSELCDAVQQVQRNLPGC